MRIAFAGTPEPAAVVLHALAASHHDVALVVTQPDRPRGRRGTPTPSPVAAAADGLGMPVLRPASINDEDVLERLRAEDIGALCVVAFGQILRAPLLDGWPCINVHFSLLPAYRGAAPVERALMDGVTETGVTIMQMDPGLDTGPIAAVGRVPVDPQDDAGRVMDALCALAPPLLVATLDEIAAGTFAPRPQPEEGVSIAPKITDEDRALDTALPARRLADRIRALSPHIGARCTIDGAHFKVWAARALPEDGPPGLRRDGDRLRVGTGEGTLEILELQPPGRGRMSAADFLRGWRGPLELT
ncbi:MAG TPA: methionyl-tRNA formyltransferase, partial [Miltoncostaeaceae bacterium]|nr:methionyl-tRNA formyltransferase [Miltoncostaeaceae bacterium]